MSAWYRSAAALVALALCACDPSAEAAFVADRSLDPCIQAVPACPSLYAACELDEESYGRRVFPDEAPFRFLVHADANTRIEVLLFFAALQEAGTTTEVYWNEPACADVYRWDSGGRDLFVAAEDTGFVSMTQAVQSSGDHLIEIFSDMQAEVLVAVDVHDPNE